MNASEKTESQAAEPTKRKLSRGEQVFDWMVYGGIAGLGAFIGTLPVTYWAKYGKGAKYFRDASKGLQKMGLSEAGADEVLMTTALMQGGNLALIPVKMAENNKPEMVEKFNTTLGEPSDKANVENAPKQSWGSLIKSRLMAWVLVYASFRGASSAMPQKFDDFTHNFAKNAVCGPLKQPTHIAGQETKAYRYGKILALDVFATAAASALLYVGSRMFARKGRNPAETEDLADDLKAAYVIDDTPSNTAPQKKTASYATAIAEQKLQADAAKRSFA